MNLEVSSYQRGEIIEEDQKGILMIGGIQIFLPYSPVEVNVCVADATIATEGQPTETVKEEEEEGEKTLMSIPAEEKEHSEEWLKIFSQEAEKETAAALKLTTEEEEEEEEANNMGFADLCEQLEALERRVMMQHLHIQQIRLEVDEEEFQSEEQLEEAGNT
jgi:hypothetical protein